MKTEQFNKIIDEQIDICKILLQVKAKEYATEDRLHNFKVAADLQGVKPESALAGMMAKHTVSIYDLCNTDRSGWTMEIWEEKITDSINYLLLLKALVTEDYDVLEMLWR